MDTFERFTTGPIRFRSPIVNENELVFGEEHSINLMFIENKVILHVIDTATRFSIAIFLNREGKTYGQSVDVVWLALVMVW